MARGGGSRGVLKLVFDVLFSAEGSKTPFPRPLQHGGWLEGGGSRGVLKFVFDVLFSVEGSKTRFRRPLQRGGWLEGVARGGDRFLGKQCKSANCFCHCLGGGRKQALNLNSFSTPSAAKWGSKTSLEIQFVFDPPKPGDKNNLQVQQVVLGF